MIEGTSFKYKTQSELESALDTEFTFSTEPIIISSSVVTKPRVVLRNSSKPKIYERSNNKYIKKDDSSDDLVILDSVFRKYDTNIEKEISKDDGTTVENFSTEFIESPVENMHSNSLYYLSSSGYEISPKGIIAFNILKSNASPTSDKVFFNRCVKEFKENGILISDVHEFAEILEKRGELVILSNKHRAVRYLINKPSI